MRTRLAPPLADRPPTNPTHTEPDPPGQPRLRGYVRITGLAVAAIVYLILVARAASLDAHAGEMEGALAQARFSLIQAKQEFFDSVCSEPESAAVEPAPRIETLDPVETLPVPGLPRVQPSILQDAAGRGALAQATAPPAEPPGAGDRIALKP
jgi:hypothetical protein